MPGSTKEGWDEVQAGPWGLGDRRTLDQFIEFTGVSIEIAAWMRPAVDRALLWC